MTTTMPATGSIKDLELEAAHLRDVALDLAELVDDLRTCAAAYERKCERVAHEYGLDLGELQADLGDRAFVAAAQWIAETAIDVTGTQAPAHVAELDLDDLRLVTAAPAA